MFRKSTKAYLTSIKINYIQIILMSSFLLLVNTTICFAEEKWQYQRLSKNAYSEKNDTLKIKALIKLSLAFQYINQDSCLPIALNAFKLQKKSNYEQLEAYVYNCLGSAYINIGREDSSAYWFLKAIKSAQRNNNNKQAALSINNLGVFYANAGNNQLAMSFYNKSLYIRNLINDSLGIASCLNNMANTNLKLGNYLNARFQLLLAIKIKIALSDTISIGRSFINLSNTYLYTKESDKAEISIKLARKWLNLAGAQTEIFSIYTNLGASYYFKNNFKSAKIEFENALENVLKSKDLFNIAIAYNNLGEVETELDNFDKAENYFLKSVAICNQINDYESEAITYMGMAQIYEHKKNHAKAISYYKKACEILDKYDFKPNLSEGLNSISKVYELSGDHKNALESFKKHTEIERILELNNSKEKIQKLEYENELAQKQSQISILEKEKELADSISLRNKLFIGFLFLIILAISIILVIALKSRKAKIIDNLLIKRQSEELSKQAEELTKLNAIKDKTFSILSHDLKSPIVALQQTLNLLDENLIDKDEFIIIKDSLKEKYINLNQLLDNLLNWSRVRMSGVNSTNPESISVEEIINQNLKLFIPQIEQKKLNLICQIDKNAIVYADPNQLDLIIRNILTNAIKFSFSKANIIIESKKQDSICLITIKDFGTGMNPNVLETINQGDSTKSKVGTNGEKGTGIGLMISRDFIIQNNGKLIIESESGKGSTFIVELPAA
jgi:signal transduction histidine kinase/Tfp pilus assembly protein PilF